MNVPGIAHNRDLHDDYRRRYLKTKKIIGDKFAAADGKDLLRNAPVTQLSPRGNVLKQWMVFMRRDYEGCVIRRTIETLDLNGKPISGLPPMHNEIIMIKLSTHEQEVMDRLAAGHSDEGKTNLVSSFAFCYSPRLSEASAARHLCICALLVRAVRTLCPHTRQQLPPRMRLRMLAARVRPWTLAARVHPCTLAARVLPQTLAARRACASLDARRACASSDARRACASLHARRACALAVVQSTSRALLREFLSPHDLHHAHRFYRKVSTCP